MPFNYPLTNQSGSQTGRDSRGPPSPSSRDRHAPGGPDLMRQMLLLAGRKATSAHLYVPRCQLESSPRLTAATPAASSSPKRRPHLSITVCFLALRAVRRRGKPYRPLPCAWLLSPRDTDHQNVAARANKNLGASAGTPALWHTPPLSPRLCGGRRTVRVIPTPGVLKA